MEGEQGNQVNPSDARTFLTNFGHSPDALKTMQDPDVIKLHGTVSTTHKKALDEAVAAATKNAGQFPEKWREQYVEAVKGDDKLLARLSRYTTPHAAMDALIAAQNRISSGELRSVLPKDATPEQVLAWRKENNIPEAADKYDLKLKDGLVIGDEDKPILDAILGRLHWRHVTNEQASELVNAYYETLEAESKKGTEARTKQEQAVTDALNAKWGGEYRGNMNRISALIDGNVPAGSKLKDKIIGALKVDQEFAELMETFARQINPVTALLPGAGTTGIASAITDELNMIRTRMREDRAGYDKDAKMQARFQELLDAESRLKSG